MFRARAVAFLACVILAACDKPPMRRWDEITYLPAVPRSADQKDAAMDTSFMPKVTLTSYPTPPDSKAATPDTDKKVTVTSLSDHGQGALVEGIERLIAAEGAYCGVATKAAPKKDARFNTTPVSDAAPGNGAPTGDAPPKNSPATGSPAKPPAPANASGSDLPKKVPCLHGTLLDALGISSADAGGDKGPPSVGYQDATSFKRTIVVNVLNGAGLPQGDRLRVFTLTAHPTDPPDPSDPKVQFSGYTVAQTQSSLSKFGTVTQGTEFDAAAKIDPSLAGSVKGTGELSAVYKDTNSVVADLSEPVVPLNVNITGGDLFIQKRGDAITDITGNTIVALTVKVPTKSDLAALVVGKASLFKNGAPVSPAAATLAVTYMRYAPQKDVTVDLTLDYQLRHIVDGAKTITEGDDSIVMYTGSVSQTGLTLIPKEDIAGEKWLVLATDANSISPKCEQLEATLLGFGTVARPLYFADEVAARNFLAWLEAARSPEEVKKSKSYPDSVNLGQLAFKVRARPIDWKLSPRFEVVSLLAWNSVGPDSCRN